TRDGCTETTHRSRALLPGAAPGSPPPVRGVARVLRRAPTVRRGRVRLRLHPRLVPCAVPPAPPPPHACVLRRAVAWTAAAAEEVRVRRLIVQMRKRNLSVYDIADALRARHMELSPTAVAEVLREEGFAKLPRRGDDERPDVVRPDVADHADVRRFQLAATSF